MRQEHTYNNYYDEGEGSHMTALHRLFELTDRLRTYQAILVLAVVALLVLGRSIPNGFVGDDYSQIVNNPVIHSLRNLPLFFQGGTFYDNGGIAPLAGVYYRPLMTTTFALLYAVAGEHAAYYHVLQLLLYIGCASMVFLLFRLSMRPAIALLCAVLFLVHPINSQNAFALAAMQEVLMCFFGMLGLWLLTRLHSRRSLLLVAACLTVALFAKESALLFVLLAFGMLGIWDRKRIAPFALVLVPLLAAWLAARTTAIGFFTNPHNAPITDISLSERLLTIPSVFSYYMGQLVAPIKISAMSYWTVTEFSVSRVLLPILVICVVAGLFGVLGYIVYTRGPKSARYDYLFYAAWFIMSYAIISQIHALDMTACPSWFYTPFIGLVGMLAIGLTNIGIPAKAWRRRVIPCSVVVLVIATALSGRTFVRAHDWRDDIGLAAHDITSSRSNQDNYNYAYVIAQHYLDLRDYSKAAAYAQQSVDGYAVSKNTFLLGKIEYLRGNYAAAYAAFEQSSHYLVAPSLYEYMALCLLHTGQLDANRKFYTTATTTYPTVANLWQIWAVYEYTHADNASDSNTAKALIARAQDIDPTNIQIQATYGTIMSGKPLSVD